MFDEINTLYFEFSLIFQVKNLVFQIKINENERENVEATDHHSDRSKTAGSKRGE